MSPQWHMHQRISREKWTCSVVLRRKAASGRVTSWRESSGRAEPEGSSGVSGPTPRASREYFARNKSPIRGPHNNSSLSVRSYCQVALPRGAKFG